MSNHILLRRRFKLKEFSLTPSDNDLAYMKYNSYIRDKLFKETRLPENYITDMKFLKDNLP